MLLLASELPVALEVINADGGALSSVQTTLCHLSDDYAAFDLSAADNCACLHWGARVRFLLVDGMEAFSLLGSVVQRETIPGSARNARIIVKLMDCLPVPQRRRFERRRDRIPLAYLPDREPDGEEGETDAGETGDWQSASIFDLGAGGLRFRATESLRTGQRLSICLTLPGSASAAPVSLCLRGVTLRVTRVLRAPQTFEVAVKFGPLPVETGLRLAGFLS